MTTLSRARTHGGTPAVPVVVDEGKNTVASPQTVPFSHSAAARTLLAGDTCVKVHTRETMLRYTQGYKEITRLSGRTVYTRQFQHIRYAIAYPSEQTKRI